MPARARRGVRALAWPLPRAAPARFPRCSLRRCDMERPAPALPLRHRSGGHPPRRACRANGSALCLIPASRPPCRAHPEARCGAPACPRPAPSCPSWPWVPASACRSLRLWLAPCHRPSSCPLHARLSKRGLNERNIYHTHKLFPPMVEATHTTGRTRAPSLCLAARPRPAGTVSPAAAPAPPAPCLPPALQTHDTCPPFQGTVQGGKAGHGHARPPPASRLAWPRHAPAMPHPAATRRRRPGTLPAHGGPH